ncbi:MAG: signal peptidase II [Planctomycetaceae bacterium]|nr:signal peptidase II [Planctomycetaceae bacterium]
MDKSTEKQSVPVKQVTPAVPRNRYALFLVIAVGALVADLASKQLVFSGLGYPGGISAWTQTYLNDWITFRFFTSFNEGALWGMGQGYSFLFAGLSVLAAVGICCWLFLFRAAHSLWLTVTLALVMGGTLGNLYDRLGWHGYEVAGRKMFAVRDFLAFTFGNYHYPIFNIADVCLVTGAIMLAIYSIMLDLVPAHQPGTAQANANPAQSPVPSTTTAS